MGCMYPELIFIDGDYKLKDNTLILKLKDGGEIVLKKVNDTKEKVL